MSETLALEVETLDDAPIKGARSFVLTIAACSASAALSIDLMLPAFPDMRADFGLGRDSTAVVWTLTAFFLGLAAGQLVYGPLSDRFGRKPLMYLGLVTYFLGASAAALAPSLTAVIVCRAIWGFGTAGPRSLSVAMVRDRFAGARMARTMSHVMATFIIVPILAPAFGALLLKIAPWQVVFWVPAGFALLLLVAIIRLPETLPPSARRSIAPRALASAFRIVVTDRRVAAFAFALMCLLGVMTGMLGNFEILFEDVFRKGDLFPVAFALVALSAGVMSVLNARVVERVGLRRSLVFGAAYALTLATVLTVVTLATGGRPAMLVFLILMMLLFPSVVVMMSNSQAAAMIPVPHVAGMAAAVLGAISTGGGALLGSITAAAFDGTATPFALLTLLFVALGAGSVLLASRWVRA